MRIPYYSDKQLAGGAKKKAECDYLKKIFSARLRSAMRVRKVNAKELLHSMEMDSSGKDKVLSWVNGVTLPTVPTVVKLAMSLKVPTDWLFGYDWQRQRFLDEKDSRRIKSTSVHDFDY